MRAVLALLAAAAALTGGLRGQSPAPPQPAAVELASRYVEAYVTTFSAVVSEEHQTQTLRHGDGRVKKVRNITADFLLVATSAAWPLVFRDVISVDGKPVRNREDRLRKLFLDHPKTAVDLAQAIAKESQRYNIGLERTGNSPLLPLIFLTSKILPGVRFEAAGQRLAFEETHRPTVLGRRSNSERFDLPSRGWYEIDPQSGRIRAAELTAEGPPGKYSVSLKVRFEREPRLDLSVPVEVDERYWRSDRPKDDVLETHATYSGFRRFQVTTGEQIKTPR